jgi:Tfp pilus assembly protein PilO
VTARLNSLSPRAQVALVCAGLLLVAVLGYFVLISPKRSTASELKKQTADVQAQIDQNQSTAFQQALPAVRSASIFSLAKAMPKQVEMPNVILQLSQLASDSGITFDSITPSPQEASSSTTPTTDPFAIEPIQVTFTGNFYDLLAFLMRLRNLVRVDNGKLYSAGRLFDVSDIGFAAAAKGFPAIQAQLTVNAFVPVQPQPAAPTSTTTTGTTTTSTGTTTTTSNPPSASPATSGGGS